MDELASIPWWVGVIGVVSKSATRHNRKVRRKTRSVLKHGPGAAPVHKSKSGRTGMVHAKKLGSRRKKA